MLDECRYKVHRTLLMGKPKKGRAKAKSSQATRETTSEAKAEAEKDAPPVSCHQFLQYASPQGSLCFFYDS